MSSTRNENFSTRYPQCVKPSTLTLSTLVTRVLFDAASYLCHLVVDRAAFFHQLADFLVGIHHGGVVPVAEKLPNFWQREAGHLPAEVHGHLPGERNGL